MLTREEAATADVALLRAAIGKTDDVHARRLLGEALYARITDMASSDCGQITGMLLELELGDILQLLEDSHALRAKVTEAQEVLTAHRAAAPELPATPSVDADRLRSLGELLYYRIREIDAARCGKITGMLLELGATRVSELLDGDNPNVLRVLVAQAVATLDQAGAAAAAPSAHTMRRHTSLAPA